MSFQPSAVVFSIADTACFRVIQPHISKHSADNKPIHVQMHTFCHDVHSEQSCMVRHATYASENHPWHIFAFGQVVSRRRDPLKPLITMFGHIHSRVREMMRANAAIDPEFVFDEVLTSYNEQWRGLFAHSDVKYLLASSCVIGVIKGGRMCVADRGMCVGKMVTMLDGRATIIPVLTTRSDTTPSSALFESIVCGALPLGCRVVLGTSQLRSVGRNDVFVQLLSKRTTPLDIIWQRMQKKLRIAGDPAVSGVLISTYPETELSGSTNQTMRFSDYVHAPPASHLTAISLPSRWLVVSLRRLGAALALMYGAASRAAHALARRLPDWVAIPGPVMRAWASCRTTCARAAHAVSRNATVRILGRSGRMFIAGIARGILLGLLYLGVHTARPVRQWIRWMSMRFARLTTVQKIAFSAVCVAAVGIILGVYLTRLQAARAEATRLERELNERFDEHLAVAESKLVFGNIPEAKQALAAAESVVDQLRQAEADVSREHNRLQAIRNELLKEMPVSLQTVAYSFADGAVVSMAASPPSVFVWNESQLVDVSNLRTVGLTREVRSSSVVARGEQGVVFIDDASFHAYSNSGSSLTLGDIITSGITRIIAAQQYGGRLYTLDGGGHVFRHGASSDGFGKGTRWSSAEVESPIDIAIDGNVYVLSSNGFIAKYFKGDPVPYDISSVDPPFRSPRQIWTDTESRSVYVLEPSRRRLVALSKTGLMQIQYIFDKPIESFAIDETAGRGFVAVGRDVYRFELSHLAI